MAEISKSEGDDVNMFSYKNIAVFLILMFILSGCAMDDNTELPNITMLIAGHGSVAPTILEIIDENILQVTVVHENLFHADIVDVDSYELFTRESIIGDQWIDDFIVPPSLDDTLFPEPENWYRKIADSGEIHLSESQVNRIRRLARNVAAREEQEFEHPPIRGNITFVWVNIDDKMYWSMYLPHLSLIERDEREFFNRDLLLLAYELIELSPVPVGADDFFSPLETPRDFE